MTSSSGSLPKRRHRWRSFLLVLAAGFLLLWVCWAGYQVLKPRYRHWKGERAVRQARVYVADKDFDKARIALRVAFQSGANREAYGVLADLLESVNSFRAVDARRAMARATPGDLDAELSLAATALHFGDRQTALEALSGCSAADRGTPQYRRVAAIFALSANQPALADYLLTELEKSTPGDAGARLLHAALLLRHPEPAKATAARAELIELTTNPEQRVPALRVLLDDALIRRDPAAARGYGAQLGASPGAAFQDLLNAANSQLLFAPHHRLEAGLVNRIDAEAGKSPDSAAQYVRWLVVQNRSKDATAWLDRLPPSLASRPEVHVFRSQIAVAGSDWNALRAELTAGAWGPLSPDAIEFAYSARLLLRRGQPDLARQTWAAALLDARNSDTAMQGLQRLAEVWRWPDAARDSLFALVRGFPHDTENYPQLVAILRSRREAAAMRDVFALWREAAPDVPTVNYNWAFLALLTSPAAVPSDATREMQTLITKNPANPDYVTGAAFALWQLGKIKEACILLDGLSEDDRRLPARAPYVAIIYASDARVADAKAAIARAPKAEALLPEENALIAKASALCAG